MTRSSAVGCAHVDGGGTPVPGAVLPPAGGVFGADPLVGADLARVDWAATPLGEPEHWPQSLRTAVQILLSSRFAMWMAWGPELTFFCNDAYRRDTLGQRYPWALGRPFPTVWPEVWEDVRLRVDSVLHDGVSTWDEDLLLFLERSGYPEESYHTFSYSPLRDESGAVAGVLCVVNEETQRVVAERRMATLRDLGSDPGAVRTEGEFLAFAAEQLARNPYSMPFTLTYLFEEGGSARLAASSGIDAAHPAAPARLPADTEVPWPVAAARQGHSRVVDLDAAPVFDGLPHGMWSEPPARALVVPLTRAGESPDGFLVSGLNRFRPLDGDYRAFLGLVAGHLAAGIASARDHEAQRRRAEELAELDRAKTAFFSNVSHEFRTPLTLMTGPVGDLRRRLADAGEDVRADLEAVHRNGLRLGRLVNALLDFSRIEAGRLRAAPVPVDLSAVTADLASVFRSAMEAAGLAFEVDCPPLPAPVALDTGLWEQVVFNLLSNALKFTPEGAVRVRVRAVDGRAELTVQDTGTGIPAAQLPHLFERFHRVDNPRARSQEGSGIGLALARELVELHGGTLTAVSVEDEGSSFTAALPLRPGARPTEPASSGPPSPGAQSYLQEALGWLQDAEEPDGRYADPSRDGSPATAAAATRVLVADDNADMRRYLARILRGAGHLVTVVADGRRALAAARAHLPDLVVSDVMMPGLDGLHLAQALRTDSRTAGVPILLLSARAGQEAAVEGLAAGADDYLVKPFAAAELLAHVRSIVDLSRVRSRHARWRTALVDSLHDAFFVCDGDGAVVETNPAFAALLGHGPEHLPSAPPHPWWPDADTEPDAHRRTARAFARLVSGDGGRATLSVRHADGKRLWVQAACNRVQDPDTGTTVTVGTFRDVTAEYHAIRREGAVAALGEIVADAVGVAGALDGAVAELRALWDAERVLAVLLPREAAPVPVAWAPAAQEAAAVPRHRDLAAVAGAPMLAPMAVPGGAVVLLEHPAGPLALLVELGGRRPFTREDELLLTLLAGRLAQGLARAHRIDQQRETAIALQRAILGPADLPQDFAVRYEPATRPLEVGGDWYDTVPLRDGRIGIVVGDCVGRGIEAATVMGQLRSACRALLLQDRSPARTLAALDEFAAGVPGALCTTVFCAVLDPVTGVLRYSIAAHPPGIVALADGGTVLLDDGRSLPLAVAPDTVRPEAVAVLPAGSVLLLATDGLAERRGVPLPESVEHAARALAENVGLPLDRLADRLMQTLAPPGGYEDDVALLLYHHGVAPAEGPPDGDDPIGQQPW
ncbi:SpoIIE family protein phosphatase [Kitasatospora sp. NPDC059160]|uniref:SpoIIE family protein phosphatase n=1 Tax=Kitasatospora sp. NPDC059160 TaxID=3346748 RepID=UPI003680BAFA